MSDISVTCLFVSLMLITIMLCYVVRALRRIEELLAQPRAPEEPGT